ncbi:(deoxy)nucleoside triphosphate pyrophosphohydrolase [bacterium]|nr:(deoxy)nucleoside triphosphate pyrophosphohydrolase [bacterium]
MPRIRRFQYTDAMIIVTAAVIEKDGKMLIARRKPGSSLAGLWEFPGGKLEEGEEPRDCLRRELHEEFGIDTEIGEHVMSNVHEYDHIKIELRSYRAKYTSGAIKLVDHDKIAWVKPEEFSQYDLAPADLPTVEVILKEKVDGKVASGGA